jgi:CBS domain-containing protein
MSPRAAWRLESLGFSKVFDYMAGKMDWMAFGLPVEGEGKITLVAERLVREWPVCQLAETTSDAKQRAQATGASFCPVLNDGGIVLGVVEKEDWEVPESMPVEDIMDSGPTTLRPSYSVDDATQLLKSYKQEAILVTSSDGKLMGVFKRGESGKDPLPKSEIWA